MLDGAARLGNLFERTAEMGMPALAMTDHGNVFGAHDFYRQARAPASTRSSAWRPTSRPNTSRFERTGCAGPTAARTTSRAAGAYTHMTLLSESTDGMHNLFRLASRASLEGFFYKPRADRELLAEYADGLIGTTGCPSGEMQTWLRIGDYDKARASAAEFRDIFGDEQLLPRADGPRPGHREPRCGTACCGSRKDLRLPMVATNDLHYTDAADADRARGAAVRAVRQDPGRPEPVQARRPRLLPQVAAGDAGDLGRTSTSCRRRATTPC